MPVGSITRGTTGTNRLRRVDRWIARAAGPAARRRPARRRPRLRCERRHDARARTPGSARARPDVEVLGLEIDPARVRTATRAARRVRAGDGHFPADLPRRVRPRRLRGADARRTAARGDPRVQRAAAVRRGRGRRRLAQHGRAAGARRARSSRARATSSAASATWVGDRRTSGPRTLHDLAAAAPASRRRRSSRSGCRRRSSTGTCPASASTTCSRRSTRLGACTRRCRSTAGRSAGSPPWRRMRHAGLAGHRRAAP